jgi:hypothetical protein
MLTRSTTWLVLLALGMIATPPGHAQASAGYQNFGFRSYAGGNANYRQAANSGMGGYPQNNNSYNTGFSGMSRSYSGRTYNTSRSSMAAQQLAQRASAIWQNTPVGKPNGIMPQMSKKEMLRIFMEGGTPETPMSSAPAPDNSGRNSEAKSTAYNNYQTAENEARKARNARERTRGYDKDQWHRKNDAEQAQYAANNANYAAQRAEYAGNNGDEQARHYAGLARAAANRAREDANYARYNADTMH